MKSTSPVEFFWNGSAMMPIDRHKARASHQFVDGEVYRLVHEEERSQRSHSHFFASLHEGWQNLAEEYADRFVNEDHLRKWCLIREGYAHETKFILANAAEAQHFAAIMARYDSYAVIDVAGSVVRMFTAMSQSKASMGAKMFQASKTAVLDRIALMARTTAQQLTDESRRYG